MTDSDKSETEPIPDENPALAAARASRRRGLAIGLIAGALLAAAVVAADAFFVSRQKEDGGSSSSDLQRSAKAAGCELRSVKVKGRGHVAGRVSYPSSPPAGGDHLKIAAEDGFYTTAPRTEALVQALENGRVVVWFRPSLSAALRGRLKDFYDGDSSQLLVTPDRNGMAYELAASAWSREPEPLGTGRLLGCARVGQASFDALAAFRDAHRGHGPEPVR